MKEKEIKDKVQKAQKDLFEAILDFFRANPDSYYTAKDISEKLDLMPGHNNWFSHAFLRELKEQVKLEQSQNRKGFKYKE